MKENYHYHWNLFNNYDDLHLLTYAQITLNEVLIISNISSSSSSNIAAEASKASNDVKSESDKTESKAKSAGKKKGGSPKKKEKVKAIEEEVSGIVNNVGRHKRHFKTDGERIEKSCLVKMELFNSLPLVSAL